MFNVLVLSQEDTKKLLTMDEVISVVEMVYTKKAMNKTCVYPMVFHEFNPGVADMDIKSGEITDDVFGLKMVSWFLENPKKKLPALIGTILICDAKTGVPMGIVDGSYITGMRTGAAAAIGAKYLANKNSETLLMVGAGHISLYAVAASILSIPTIKTVVLSSPISPNTEDEKLEKLKLELQNEFNLNISSIEFKTSKALETSVPLADIIITATPSKEALIKKEWVKKGTHISCIGADMPAKQEIDKDILKGGVIFTDDTEQCVSVGEIENAIKASIISREDIAGEIGECIIKSKLGRKSDEDITIFDATGMALLDLATAKIALLKAQKKEIGTQANL